MKKKYLMYFFLLAVVCLSGCGKPRIDLNVASQPNVNPDNSGRASPVLVKVYELRNDLTFKQADFSSLFTTPVPVLGADLIAADELVFVPGEARKISYSPMPETRYIGLVAGFRQMERAHWRVIKPVNPEEKNFVSLEFNDVTILVIPDKQAENWDPEKAVKDFQQRMTRPQAAPATPAQARAGQGGGLARPLAQTAGGRTTSAAGTVADQAGGAIQGNAAVNEAAQQGASAVAPASANSGAATPATSPVRVMRPY